MPTRARAMGSDPLPTRANIVRFEEERAAIKSNSHAGPAHSHPIGGEYSSCPAIRNIRVVRLRCGIGM
jgi:hypothetical protein